MKKDLFFKTTVIGGILAITLTSWLSVSMVALTAVAAVVIGVLCGGAYLIARNARAKEEHP